MARKKDKASERKEALMRIVVLFITGIILSVWQILIRIFIIVNFLITLFTGERNKELARLSEFFNTQVYVFLRYVTFSSNHRPWPFTKLPKSMDKPE